MNRDKLEEYLDKLLKINIFQDYCINGLQVEGCKKIQRIVTGVTASQALINAALKWNADTILVHHGIFWKNELSVIRGIKYKRLNKLITNNINLFVYHLPLDVHIKLGNNVQLGKQLKFTSINPLCTTNLVWKTSLTKPVSTTAFGKHIFNVLKRKPLILGPNKSDIRHIAWCTGNGQKYFTNAIEAGMDAFISGEVSEQITHIARETGVVYFSAGHHATEIYGIKTLGNYLQNKFNIDVNFINIDNPV